jgi:hypothetical protein
LPYVPSLGRLYPIRYLASYARVGPSGSSSQTAGHQSGTFPRTVRYTQDQTGPWKLTTKNPVDEHAVCPAPTKANSVAWEDTAGPIMPGKRKCILNCVRLIACSLRRRSSSPVPSKKWLSL